MKGNWDSEFILNRSERRIVNIKEDGYLLPSRSFSGGWAVIPWPQLEGQMVGFSTPYHQRCFQVHMLLFGRCNTISGSYFCI